MTENELLAAIKISPSGLQKWITKGLPYTVVHNRRRFNLREVQAWRKANITPKPGPELLAGRVRLQHIRNEEREFKLAILKGQCVERVKVDKYLFATGRQVRDGMLALPDRLSAMLTAESDAHRCHAILTQEIERVLEGLCTQPPWGDGTV
ncbi:MAG: hypothetical protein HZB34_03615 [Nitrospirae bacterium]|nr:hypothetical protein [Nitrospirota bacterium]